MAQGSEATWYGVNLLPSVHHAMVLGHYLVLGYDAVTFVRRRRGSPDAAYLVPRIATWLARTMVRESHELSHGAAELAAV